MNLYTAGRISLYVIGGLMLFLIAGLAFGYLVQWLWNTVVVAVFGLPALSFWQAVGLYVLAKLFFGFMPGGSSPERRRQSGKSRVDAAAGAEVPPGNDEAFARYWREEGREAYTRFLASRQADRDEGPRGS